MTSSAVLSECRTYRYLLKRQWGPLNHQPPRLLGFLMLNPSTADENVNDRTINRCIGFGKSLGYDGIIVANLFAYRSPHPEMLKSADAPIGPGNDLHIEQFVHMVETVICAWGTPLADEPEHKERVKAVLAIVAEVQGLARVLPSIGEVIPRLSMEIPLIRTYGDELEDSAKKTIYEEWKKGVMAVLDPEKKQVDACEELFSALFGKRLDL